jgi:ferredoxin-NADP reductase
MTSTTAGVPAGNEVSRALGLLLLAVPPDTALVSVLRDGHRDASPALTLRRGDRISLLAPTGRLLTSR